MTAEMSQSRATDAEWLEGDVLDAPVLDDPVLDSAGVIGRALIGTGPAVVDVAGLLRIRGLRHAAILTCPGV